MNNISLAGLFVTSPSAAYSELDQRPRFLFPLIALALATAIVTTWYYVIVDFEWFKDYIFSANNRVQEMPAAEREKMMSVMSLKIIAGSGVISAVLGLPMIFAIQAAYFLLAGKVTNVQKSFMHWFALVCWSNVPTFIGLLAAVGMLLTEGSGAQIGPEALQVLSLNDMFFHTKMGDPGFRLYSSLTIFSLWGWGLAIYGVRQWSNRSWLFSSMFVLLPFIVIYGLVAAFAF
jgi:hypothetical protein